MTKYLVCRKTHDVYSLEEKSKLLCALVGITVIVIRLFLFSISHFSRTFTIIMGTNSKPWHRVTFVKLDKNFLCQRYSSHWIHKYFNQYQTNSFHQHRDHHTFSSWYVHPFPFSLSLWLFLSSFITTAQPPSVECIRCLNQECTIISFHSEQKTL